jgi:hypothetical protein
VNEIDASCWNVKVPHSKLIAFFNLKKIGETPHTSQALSNVENPTPKQQINKPHITPHEHFLSFFALLSHTFERGIEAKWGVITLGRVEKCPYSEMQQGRGHSVRGDFLSKSQ